MYRGWGAHFDPPDRFANNDRTITKFGQKVYLTAFYMILYEKLKFSKFKMADGVK